MTTHHYRLYGLAIASDVALPGLAKTGPSAVPDVEIAFGSVTAGSATLRHIERVDGGAILRIEGVADFAIMGGRSIVVDPSATAEIRNVRLFLLGSVMGMLLHQRGILPLHANAVVIDGRVCAFMGHSGAGKSTLAAWFHDRGHAVISDDVCAILFDGDGAPVVGAGLLRLRLRTDALLASGRRASSFKHSYAGDDSYDKFDVPLQPNQLLSKDLPLAAIYLLDTHDEFAVTRIEGIDAAAVLFEQTYRGQYLTVSGTRQEHWQSCLRLIDRTSIYRVQRRWDYAFFEDDFEQILSHARSAANAGGTVAPEQRPSGK